MARLSPTGLPGTLRAEPEGQAVSLLTCPWSITKSGEGPDGAARLRNGIGAFGADPVAWPDFGDQFVSSRGEVSGHVERSADGLAASGQMLVTDVAEASRMIGT